MDSKATTTGAPATDSASAGTMPEFLRPKEAVRLFSVGKSTLATWIADGAIKSHLVRRRGNQSGIRLIATDSLRAYIKGHDAH